MSQSIRGEQFHLCESCYRSRRALLQISFVKQLLVLYRRTCLVQQTVENVSSLVGSDMSLCATILYLNEENHFSMLN